MKQYKLGSVLFRLKKANADGNPWYKNIGELGTQLVLRETDLIKMGATEIKPVDECECERVKGYENTIKVSKVCPIHAKDHCKPTPTIEPLEFEDMEPFLKEGNINELSNMALTVRVDRLTNNVNKLIKLALSNRK